MYLAEFLLVGVWVFWFGTILYVWRKQNWPGWILHVSQGGVASLLGIHLLPHANLALSDASQSSVFPIWLTFTYITTLTLSIPLTVRQKKSLRPLTAIELGALILVTTLLSNSAYITPSSQSLNTLMGLSVTLGLFFTGIFTNRVLRSNKDFTRGRIALITTTGLGMILLFSSLSWIRVVSEQPDPRSWLEIVLWCLVAIGSVAAVGLVLNLLISITSQYVHLPHRLRSFFYSENLDEETPSAIDTVREAALQLPANLDRETVLGGILEKALRLTGADDAHIFLFDGRQLSFGGAMWSGDFRREPYSDPRSGGITYTVARTGAAIIVPDVNHHPLFADDPWGGAIISQPLKYKDEVIGIMNVAFKKPHEFQPEELQLLALLSDQAAVILTNMHLYSQTERRLAEMTAVREVMQVVNRRLEMTPLLDAIIRQVRDVLGYPLVEILLVEDEELVVVARAGEEGLMGFRHKLTEGVSGRVAQTNQAAYVPDVKQDPDYLEVVASTRSEIAVPLSTGGLVMGVLNVESPETDSLTADDLRLLTILGDQIAIALENAGLYEKVQQHADELEQTVQERTAALEQALELAREADTVRTRFVSDVSHELRTPLSNIRLYLSLLDRERDQKFVSYLDTLNRETDRLISLIEDLLAISRLDAGTSVPVPSEVDLNQVAKDLVMDRQRLFAERQLGLEMALEPDMPPVTADESMLTQAIATLLTNAMNYTPTGGQVWIDTSSQPPEWVTLTVRDNGLGITRNEISQIFERFFRGTASRIVGNPGTGLGLAICQEIIARQGGKITVDSTVGEGSSFTIWLPMLGPAQETYQERSSAA